MLPKVACQDEPTSLSMDVIAIGWGVAGLYWKRLSTARKYSRRAIRLSFPIAEAFLAGRV